MSGSNTEITFTPIETQRASEAIYKQISDKITNGELQPGDRLPSERAMMDLFQRSRPTIREALRMLERNGLVQIIPGTRGALVTTPGSSTLSESLENLLSMDSLSEEDILECRETLEKQASVWACERRTEDELNHMETILQGLREDADIEDVIRNDLDFHTAIADASHNRFMHIVNGVLHKAVWNRLRLAFDAATARERKRMVKEIIEKHREIFECIRSGDAEKCVAAMEDHMRRFQKDILSQ